MINEYINELVAYGMNQGVVDPEDEVYVTNRLLELFQLTEHEGTAKEVRSERELSQILNDSNFPHQKINCAQTVSDVVRFSI